MAHVYVAKYYCYEVSEITVTPFGFIAQIHYLDHGKIYQRIFILAAGLSMHIIYPILFLLFYKMQVISYSYMCYLMQINYSIFVFNLLPIYPLDGGRLLLCIFQIFIKYNFSRIIVLCISFFILLWMFQISNWNMRILFVFLFIILILEVQKNKIDYVEYRYNQIKHLKLKENHV